MWQDTKWTGGQRDFLKVTFTCKLSDITVLTGYFSVISFKESLLLAFKEIHYISQVLCSMHLWEVKKNVFLFNILAITILVKIKLM